MATACDRSCNLQSKIPFFTEENYNKLSIIPSLESLLQEYYGSDGQSNDSIHFQESLNSELESPKIGCPFPRKSSLTWTQQRTYLELYHKLSSCMPQQSSKEQLDEIELFKTLQMQVGHEQEEFMNFLRSIAVQHPEDYSFISSKVKKYMEKYTECCMKRVLSLPCYYILQQTLSLKAGAVYKTDSIMKFIKYLLIVNESNVSEQPSSYKAFAKNQTTNQKIHENIDWHSQKDLKNDSEITDLVVKNAVDFVITSEALITLLDNHQPKYDQQWEIPFTVQSQKTSCGTKKVIVIDSPLMKKCHLPKVQNTIYHTEVLKLFINGRLGFNSETETLNQVDKSTLVQKKFETETQKKIQAQGQEIKTETGEVDFGDDMEINNLETFIASREKDEDKSKPESNVILKSLKKNTEKSDAILRSDINKRLIGDRVVKTPESYLENEIDGSGLQNQVEAKKKELSIKQSMNEFQDNTETIIGINKTSEVTDQESKTLSIESKDPSLNDKTICNKNESETQRVFFSDSSDTEHELVIALDSSSHDERNTHNLPNSEKGFNTDCNDSPQGVTTRSRKRNNTDSDNIETKFNSTLEEVSSPLRRSKRIKSHQEPETLKETEVLAKAKQSKEIKSHIHEHRNNLIKNNSKEVVEEMDTIETPGEDSFISNSFSPNEKVLEENKIGHMKLDDTKMPTQTSECLGEVIYSLWSFGRLNILVKNHVDARFTTVTQQNVPLHVQSKLEYQAAFGHEQLTVSEVCQGWLKLFLTPGSQLVRGRINVTTSELLRLDYFDLNSILNPLVQFNPGQSMKMMHLCLKTISCLSEGQYLLSHNAGDLHACIYQKTNPVRKKSCYDLHNAHQINHMGNYDADNNPWLPLDPNVPLKQFTDQFRIPATFPPKADTEEKYTKTVKATPFKKRKKKKKQKKI